jgi:hypothetical protein
MKKTKYGKERKMDKKEGRREEIIKWLFLILRNEDLVTQASK